MAARLIWLTVMTEHTDAVYLRASASDPAMISAAPANV